MDVHRWVYLTTAWLCHEFIVRTGPTCSIKVALCLIQGVLYTIVLSSLSARSPSERPARNFSASPIRLGLDNSSTRVPSG